MEGKASDTRYEQLYEQLLFRAEDMHQNNKKRIRIGTGILVALPAVLGFIRWITGSDKIVFLIIWVFCMFAVSAYLIGVEYLDDSIQKTLEDVTDRETEFDDLIPDTGQLQDALEEKLSETKASGAEMIEDYRRSRREWLHEIHETREERRSERHEERRERRERLHDRIAERRSTRNKDDGEGGDAS